MGQNLLVSQAIVRCDLNGGWIEWMGLSENRESPQFPWTIRLSLCSLLKCLFLGIPYSDTWSKPCYTRYPNVLNIAAYNKSCLFPQLLVYNRFWPIPKFHPQRSFSGFSHWKPSILVYLHWWKPPYHHHHHHHHHHLPLKVRHGIKTPPRGKCPAKITLMGISPESFVTIYLVSIFHL